MQDYIENRLIRIAVVELCDEMAKQKRKTKSNAERQRILNKMKGK